MNVNCFSKSWIVFVDDLVFEQYFNLDAWANDRVAYITIAGDNIIPTTFKIDLLKRDELKMSNSENPVKLKQVK